MIEPDRSSLRVADGGPRACFIGHGPLVAFAGAGVALIGPLITALAYHTRARDAYNTLNHFISELGRYGGSTTAAAFNVSVMAAGALFFIFMIGFGLRIATPLGTIARVAGCITAAVGVFPRNHLPSHLVAANVFFYGGLLTMVPAARRRPHRTHRHLSVRALSVLTASLRDAEREREVRADRLRSASRPPGAVG